MRRIEKQRATTGFDLARRRREPQRDLVRSGYEDTLRVCIERRDGVAFAGCSGVLDAVGGTHLVDAIEGWLDEIDRIDIDCGEVTDTSREGIHFLADAVTHCHAAGVEVDLHLPPVLLRTDVSVLRDVVHRCSVHP
jgi:ABC-type transporter Mla MlaB component